MAALTSIRALFIAAVVCIAAFATLSAGALAQEVPIDPGAGGGVTTTDPAPPPAVDPAPPPPPVDPPPVVEPPADPAPPAPPADTSPPPTDTQQDPAPPAERHTESSTTQRVADSPRESTTQAPPQATAPAIPADQFATPAQVPGGGAGEDWAWTDQGDAFVFGSGGSGGGGAHSALVGFARFGSIAAASAGMPALGKREREAHNVAQAYASGSLQAITDGSGRSGLFASLFGGGNSGGSGVMLLTLLGILAVIRLMRRPDWNEAFRNTTASWRPSAYVPPIEHPG